MNYIAIAGALDPIGAKNGPPIPPLNLVADFGGGGMLLAFGILAALLEAQRSGQGQVVDAAMVDGAALLTTMFHGLKASGLWRDQRAQTCSMGDLPFTRCMKLKMASMFRRPYRTKVLRSIDRRTWSRSQYGARSV